jgi:MYXO-CTERM domain-containing protein
MRTTHRSRWPEGFRWARGLAANHAARPLLLGILSLLLGSAPVMAQQAAWAYLDLENISPNDVLGTAQQPGGLFVQGGFDCAVTVAAGESCANGVGPSNGYWNVIFNEPATSLPSTFASQYVVNAPPYFPPPYGATNYPAGLNPGSVASASTNGFNPTAPFVYAGGFNQIGFTLATSSAALNVHTTNAPDFVGTPGAPVSWLYSLYDSSVGANVYAQSTLAVADNCSGSASQPINLLNCNGSLPPIVPFAQNVSFTLTSQNNVTAPTFTWSLGAFAPNVQRIEIWQINGAGVPSTNVLSTTLAPTATSYAVPTAQLVVNQEYAVDIELLVLRNPSNSGDASNDNVWSRSRSFFDFAPETSSASLPVGTSISIPIVTPTTTVGNTTYPTTYTFNLPVTEGQPAYIDPLVATGYLYQIGAGNPNFASVTPVSVIGSGSYQIYTLNGQGNYVFAANISAGSTFTFSGGGVSSFEIVGIPASANIDPANASAFITGLTFAGGGTFTGTMTPLTSNSSSASGDTTDGPIPSWALGVLGLGLLGVASRRAKRAA